jgi:hypothetical protein
MVESYRDAASVVDALHPDRDRNHHLVRATAGKPLPYAQAAIKGAVAAAVAITVKTVWTIAHPLFKVGNRLRVVLIGASAFVLDVLIGLSPIEVLLLAAVVGFFLPEVKSWMLCCFISCS